MQIYRDRIAAIYLAKCSGMLGSVDNLLSTYTGNWQVLCEMICYKHEVTPEDGVQPAVGELEPTDALWGALASMRLELCPPILPTASSLLRRPRRAQTLPLGQRQ